MEQRIDDEATSLEMLADYECPECGPLSELIELGLFTEDEASDVFGGDENGVMRCPSDECDEELELTLGAALDMLKMVAERMPELAPTIANRIAEAVDG
jgi:hypothetical protein